MSWQVYKYNNLYRIGYAIFNIPLFWYKTRRGTKLQRPWQTTDIHIAYEKYMYLSNKKRCKWRVIDYDNITRNSSKD